MNLSEWLTVMRRIDHDLDCRCWHALMSVGMTDTCEHGYSVCPLCDPCHCHEGEVIVLNEEETTDAVVQC